MTDQRPRPRRTVPVIILDAVLGVATALQSGHPPWRRKDHDPIDDQDFRSEDATHPRARTGLFWLVAAGSVVAIGTASMVVAFLRAPDGLAPLGVSSPPPAAIEPPPGGVGRTASPGPGAGGFGASPPPVDGPTSTPSAGTPTARPSAHPTTQPPPLPLTARYAAAADGQGLLGYRASVTVANPGEVPVQGWRLTVTLPRSTLTVAEVSGAKAEKNGATWTFVPAGAAATVPAGGAVEVSFEVRGATLMSASPTACTIDTHPCTGLP